MTRLRVALEAALRDVQEHEEHNRLSLHRPVFRELVEAVEEVIEREGDSGPEVAEAS